MSTKPVNVDDYRTLAQRRLPKIIFDYLEGGADDETALRHNHEVFERYRLMPRRLVDVGKRDIGIELFGRHQAAPFVIGPTGLNGALRPKGDILLAHAAERAGIQFVQSTASNASIEDVAAASKGDLWFQLYIVQRKLAEQMVRRAEAAGYSTLVLTSDVGVNGNRERDLRNNFGQPTHYTPGLIYDGVTHPWWSLDFVLNGMPQLGNFVTADSSDVEIQAAVMSRQMDASFGWDDFSWLRKLWPRKLLVKGILRPDDAERCIAAGRRWGDPFQPRRPPTRRGRLATRSPRGNPGADLGADPDRQRLSPRHQHCESAGARGERRAARARDALWPGGGW
jgi:(S)-mandelate dehydrogenase